MTTRHGGGGLCTTEIRGLSVHAGATEILDGINLTLHCGQMTAVIGPNGGGKSTLFRALLGLVPYSGSVTFAAHGGGAARMPRIGYVPQNLELDRLLPLSVLDLCTAALSERPAFLPPSRRARAAASACLARTGADALLDRRIGALSGGEMQRVLLALSLEPMPELLLLDEPLSAVDAGGLRAFYETVRDIRAQNDLTVVLISHDHGAVAEYADRAVLLRRTVLADGPPAEVFMSDAFAEAFPPPGKRGGTDA